MESWPVPFRLEWFVCERVLPNGHFFMFWMLKKETRHFKLTVVEILDDKEGEVRLGTWAYHPSCFLDVCQKSDFDVLDYRSQGWRTP